MSSDDTNKENSKKSKKSHSEGLPIQEYKIVPIVQVEGEDTGIEEIDLIELVKTIWGSRKTIYRFLAVGFVLGVFIALVAPKEYVSTSTLMPEYSTESQSGASSLLKQYGGLIGLSGNGTYNSASNAIRVDLYPQIVSSLSFQDKLARQEFYFSDIDSTVSIYNYYLESQNTGFISVILRYTIGLPGLIKNALFKEVESDDFGSEIDDGILILSKDEMGVISDLKKRISATLDEESGILTVSSEMGDPKLAAHVAKYTIEELTLYLTDYRTEKVLRDLSYIQEQLEKAEVRFKEAQLVLANFRDSNQGNLSARARTEEQRLNSEYQLSFNLYNSLTQRFEEAKLKVQEETPVFKVLQPVQVPVSDETSGALILIIILMLSGISGVCWVFFNYYMKEKTQ